MARFVALGTVVGALAASPHLAAQLALASSAVWYSRLQSVALALALAPIVFVAGGLACSVAAARPKLRQRSFGGLAACLAAFLAFVAVIRLAERVRIHTFALVAERSRPLIAALTELEAQQGSPAAQLSDLVPERISEIPDTGLKAYPDYVYVTGSDALSSFDARWALYVPCPLGVLNWDIFYYVPTKEYPQFAHGGVIERVRDWAYVHE